MCEFASLVVCKKSVHWCMEDSHEEIIEQHGLTADGARGPNVVRVEIVPPDGDPSRPLDEWRYRVDQDLLPDWHDAEDTERRARKALADLVAARVFLTGEHEVGPGYFVAAGNSTVEAGGNSTVRAWGNSTVRAEGNSTVVACREHATVRHYNAQSCRPEGPFAVMIACTGARAVCSVGEVHC